MTRIKRTSISTQEIRWRRFSHTIPSLKADCSPSTVRRMSDSSFAILSQHYMIRMLRKSREIATIMKDTWVASFRHHALPASHSPRCLIFTFWLSNPNIAITLGYKWKTKSIFLLNVIPLCIEIALKCSYFALITHMMTWPWRIAACWN